MTKVARSVLTVVMDGIGVRESAFGNAVKVANTPNLRFLSENALSRTLFAHGTYVGLPSDADMGNSEVGHNAIGAGRIFDQGAKLVDEAIQTGRLFRDKSWRELVNFILTQNGTLHLLGLLSDGNVHSHESHLFALMEQAKKEGIKKVRLHVLLDGRDVGEKSAEIYVERLLKKMAQLASADFDIAIASGGGRMVVTMDRYNADWSIVQRGWDAHVDGVAPHHFPSIDAALKFFREDPKLTDQYIPAFVIQANGQPVGKIQDGDGVVLFNFRGDRAIEISRAFTDPLLDTLKRPRMPRVYFAGMMEYDGDLHIPLHFLVAPPQITDTLGEYLASLHVRQFACSETQKFGHVTYFWNGNRSGMFNPKLEEYVEVPSDVLPFDLKPWMKAYEITEQTVARMKNKTFDFGRINLANGDMVGHTGDFDAAVVAVETVDLMLGHLIKAANESGMILMVTADHGNADEMFEATKTQDPDWLSKPIGTRPKPKTSHTLNPVPFFIYDPQGSHQKWQLLPNDKGSLGNVAATVLTLMGLPSREMYLPTLVARKA